MNLVEIPSCRHPSKALHSKDTQLILGQIRNVIMTFIPGLPNRCAPTIDQCVSRWTSGRRQDMPHRNSTSHSRQLRLDPRPTSLRQLHMKPLHLSAGEVLLDVQVQSDQREDQTHRLRRTLRGKPSVFSIVTARLKSCPDTKHQSVDSGKALAFRRFESIARRGTNVLGNAIEMGDGYHVPYLPCPRIPATKGFL